MESHSFLDKFERTLVFRISRLFFLAFVLLAIILVPAGLFLWVWGTAPPVHKQISRNPDPKPVVISIQDVRNGIDSLEAIKNVEGATQQSTRAFTPNDKAEDAIRLGSLLDSLHLLLPDRVYPWQSPGHYRAIPYTGGATEWVVDKVGLSEQLGKLVSKQSDMKGRLALLVDLCNVLQSYPETERLKAFGVFVDLYESRIAEFKQKLQENQDDYQAQLTTAAQQYESALNKKSTAVYWGPILAGSALSSVGLMAMFLVMLSIERSLKTMTSRFGEIVTNQAEQKGSATNR